LHPGNSSAVEHSSQAISVLEGPAHSAAEHPVRVPREREILPGKGVGKLLGCQLTVAQGKGDAFSSGRVYAGGIPCKQNARI